MTRSTWAWPLVALALLLGCSGGGDGPSAPPPPPDDPNPPLLYYTPNFAPDSQSISLSPPSEDLRIEVVTVGFQHAGFGGITVNSDFVPGTVKAGELLTVRVTTRWEWRSSDYYTLGVRARRPGQTKTFPLCCLGCDHQGGILQNGPCSR
jgi:hypothetical protein